MRFLRNVTLCLQVVTPGVFPPPNWSALVLGAAKWAAAITALNIPQGSLSKIFENVRENFFDNNQRGIVYDSVYLL